MRSSLKNVLNLVDAAKQEITPEKSFLNDLCRSIELEETQNKRPGSRTYKPSGMGCMRASYYTITGVEPEGDDMGHGIIGICESGTDRHERIQNAVLHMKDHGIDCEYVNVADFVKQRELTEYLDIVKEPDFENGEYETKLYHKTLNMSFLCDGIIRYKGHYYILEIKTESSYKHMNRNAVDPGHYRQATAYSIAFGINSVIFLYECRDNCNKKCFLFNVTDDMKHELIDYINVCDDYIKKEQVPPKVENDRKACAYCGYKAQCRKDS